MTYAVAEPEERYPDRGHGLASKMPVIRRVLERHPDEPSLVIGAYLDQLEELGTALDAPVIQGVDAEQGARAPLRRLPHR